MTMKGQDIGRVPEGTGLSQAEPKEGLDPTGFDPSRGMDGDVFAPRGCDDEVAAVMDRLDKLQSWLVLKATQARGDPELMSASRLVQDTRVLIVERCFKVAPR